MCVALQTVLYSLLTLLSNPQLLVDETGHGQRFTLTNALARRNLWSSIFRRRCMCVTCVRSVILAAFTSLPLTMDGYDPTVLAISSVPQPAMVSTLQPTAKAGDLLTLAIAAPSTPAATSVYHVEVVDPAGKRNLQYSTKRVSVRAEWLCRRGLWQRMKRQARGRFMCTTC